MPSATERLTFDDGAWWELRGYLTHGVQRAVEAISVRYLRMGKPAPGAQTPDIEVDWQAMAEHISEANDALLLGSTLAWSYGEISQAVLDAIPAGHYQQALRRINELYGSVPLVAPSASA